MATARLHPIFRNVFAVGHAGVGRPGLTIAAVLACGDGTVVSHGTAAALLGLVDRAPLLIDVIAPGQAGRKIDAIRRHHAPTPHPSEITISNLIPCTNPSRTIVDLAGSRGARSLRRIVERAAVLGVLDTAAIDACLSNGRRRGNRRLRETLADWLDPRIESQRRLRSELEARLLALIAAHRVPAPLCNQIVEAEGKRFEVDLLWPRRRLIVEADGRRYHDSPIAFERDKRRDRTLTLGGYTVVRVTWNQIEREPETTAAAIRRLVEAGGGEAIR